MESLFGGEDDWSADRAGSSGPCRELARFGSAEHTMNMDERLSSESDRDVSTIQPTAQELNHRIQIPEQNAEQFRLLVKHTPAAIAMFDGEMRYEAPTPFGRHRNGG